MKGLPTYKWVIVTAVVANLTATVALIINQVMDHAVATAAREDHQRSETSGAVELIRKKLEILKVTASQLATDLSGDTTVDIEARLRKIKADHGELFGVGVAFAPFAFDPDRRLYAPYFRDRPGGESEMVQVHDTYDYTKGGDNSLWYTRQMKSEEGLWQEPYYGEASGTFLAEFTSPVIRDGKIAGVTYANYSVDGIERLVATLDIGLTGYCVLSSSLGTLIYHPNRTMVQERRHLSEFLENFGGKHASHISASMARSPEASAIISDDETGEKLTVRHAKIPDTDWTLLVIFVHSESQEEIGKTWQRGCWLSVFIVLTFTSLAFLLFFREGPDEWDLSVAVTGIFIVATIVTWSLVHNRGNAKTNGEPIIGASSLEQFKRNFRVESKNRNDEDPIFIPTGLFVQSIEFESANDVLVTGYVWQKYTESQEGAIRQGVVFPESEETELTEAYRRKSGDVEVVGWYFSVKLRQQFDYDLFPFENNDVWIRIWHKDFDRNAVLIPDLAAYEMLIPEELPGLERDFVLPGWMIENSYFSMRENSYGTDFGIDGYVGQNEFPELYFNINIKRRITSPIIKHFVPLIVVLVTLYMMLSVSDRSLDEAYGFNSLAVIATATGLFFVAIFQHIDLRNNLTTSHIIYLEFLYFLTYATILLVSVNSILKVMQTVGNVREKRGKPRGKIGAFMFWPIGLGRATSNYLLSVLNAADGQVLKYLYWPVLTGVFWIITLWVYY